jgi:hypothetical protein
LRYDGTACGYGWRSSHHAEAAYVYGREKIAARSAEAAVYASMAGKKRTARNVDSSGVCEQRQK